MGPWASTSRTPRPSSAATSVRRARIDATSRGEPASKTRKSRSPGDYFYYSNALGEKEGDGLWYASDLDASHPTFHDLTLPVNSDLFSSTVVDFAPATEDSGSDDIIADGVAGATYVREAASSGARAPRHTPPRRSSA